MGRGQVARTPRLQSLQPGGRGQGGTWSGGCGLGGGSTSVPSWCPV